MASIGSSIGRGPGAYEAEFKSIQSDDRNPYLWSQCFADAGMRGGIGLLVGGSTALVLSRAPVLKGAAIGLGAGIGLGIAGVDCAERARGLWAVNASDAAAAVQRERLASAPDAK